MERDDPHIWITEYATNASRTNTRPTDDAVSCLIPTSLMMPNFSAAPSTQKPMSTGVFTALTPQNRPLDFQKTLSFVSIGRGSPEIAALHAPASTADSYTNQKNPQRSHVLFRQGLTVSADAPGGFVDAL